MRFLRRRLVLRDLSDSSNIIPLRLHSRVELEWVVFERNFLGGITIYPVNILPLSPIIKRKEKDTTTEYASRDGTQIYEGDVVSYGSFYNEQSKSREQIPAYRLERI